MPFRTEVRLGVPIDLVYLDLGVVLGNPVSCTSSLTNRAVNMHVSEPINGRWDSAT